MDIALTSQKPIMRTQILFSGRGLNLASQCICMVGYAFLTESSSSPSNPTTPFSPLELLLFPLWVTHPFSDDTFLLNSIFSLELPTSNLSFYSSIYSLRWVEVLWLLSNLTREGGGVNGLGLERW